MKRDKNGQLIFDRLNTYTHIPHYISNENNIETFWDCIYEHVNVYTDAGNPIIALNYCKSGKVICYDTTKETETTRAILKDGHPHIQNQIVKINQQFNAHLNCLSFCVLDGQFWLDLQGWILDKIFAEDNYRETEKKYIDHLVVYYKDSSPIHISKFNSQENRYEHKIGCNLHEVRLSWEILDIYDYNHVKFYSKVNESEISLKNLPNL